MKKIELQELKEIQMDILDYIDNFCRENNIQYSLSGGTLIGAIRHKGYIPWDDDIDIQMKRNDYEELIEKWNKTKHPYIFHNIESGTGIGVPFGKISDPRTLLFEPGLQDIGVNIDIFPIDKVIDEDDFQNRHKKIINLYGTSWKKNRSWSLKPNILYWKLRNLIKSAKSDLEDINDIASSKNQTNAKLLFEMIDGRIYDSPWDADAFKETIYMPFENRKYQVMTGYHEYLTATFGDYMQLPPKDKQVSHHQFEAWWK